MRLSRGSGKKRARIEIIPLIDIMFFLLATFVMVSLSMIKNQAVPVNLPTASTAVRQDHQNSLTVSVTRGGGLFLDKQPVSLEELKAQLTVWKARQSEPRIFLHGDRDAPFKDVMQVMDALRSLGITKVAMQTRAAVEDEAL